MPPKSRNLSKSKTGPNSLAAQVHAKLLGAVAFHQKGQFAQAQAIYEEILKVHPRNVDALHFLGIVASQTGDHARAADLIGKAIEVHPSDAALYSNRGLSLQALKQLEASIVSYDKAIALKPDFVEAYYNRGNALRELKQPEAAVASYDQAIAIKADYAQVHFNKGNALQELRHLGAAIACYDKAIALKPDFAEAYSNKGNALQELKQMVAALGAHEQAIAIRPDYAEAYFNRGNVLLETRQLAEAIASYDQAIGLKQDYANAYCNRGDALKECKQLEAALRSYDHAIAIREDFADAYWNKALVLLLNGDLDSGWLLHEWRWRRDSFSAPKRSFLQPLWLGTESLVGKTILLHSEQGLGDTVQFCRYAKLVARLGARVIMEVEKPLIALLQKLEGVSGLVEKGAELPVFDFHCPLMSLPLAFKTNMSSIPSEPAYLRSDPDKTANWARRMGERTKPRVGLAWSGNAEHKNDRNRSIVLSELVTKLPEGCEYVSLQREVRDNERPTLQAIANLKHYGEELKDFTDTAALIDLMDMVISVDTSVAHLSGALGKPTWILLPYCPDWRWMLDRNDSPWYPSVKLYRQETIGDWAGVMDRVGKDFARQFRAV